MNFTLNINKKPRAVDVAPDTPLLWVLRDSLNLLGTKFGCGVGLCGSCTVHLEGEAVRACQLPVSEIGSRAITTIEGLAAASPAHEHALHPLQQTWCDLDVAQCGYCQAGQIMSAAALLAKKPQPTDADIDDAMSANLCRCGTYIRIRAGIHEAARRLAEAGGAR